MDYSEVLCTVQHYQRGIIRSADNEERLMHCLKKLKHLPITMQHLQETGVGKTVNALRKFEGSISKAANDLVTSWKKVVMEEELAALQMSQCEKINECNGQETAETDTEMSKIKNERSESESKNDCNGLAGETHAESHTIKKVRGDSERKHKDKKKRSKSRERHSSKNTHEGGASSGQKSLTHVYKPQDAIDQNRNESNMIKSQEKENTTQYESRAGHQHTHKRSSSERDRNKEQSRHLEKHRSKTECVDKDEKHRTKNEDSDKTEKHRIKTEYVEQNEKHRTKPDDVNKDVKHRTKTDYMDKDEKYSIKANYLDKDEHRSSKKRKHEETSDSERHSQEEYKIKKEKKHKSMSASSSHKHHKEHKSHHKEKHSSEGSCKADSHKKSNSSEHKTLNQNDEVDVPRLKTENNNLDNDGIDSSMGANFADVLGMLNVPVKKSKKSLNIKTSTSPQKSKDNSTARLHASSSSSSHVKNGIKLPNQSSEAPSTSTSNNYMKNKPELLTSSVKLAPLDPTIVLDLPVISNNYKPLPVNPTVMDCVYNTSSSNCTATSKPQVRIMTDSEALTHSISSKTMRTKIYSGSKTGQVFQVPTLFDICIRVLQKNLDALEYTGGVPFELLRPVLERCTPQQLFAFEEYNPYIMEDSDVLWKQHVQRQYRTERRQEMESWREMYFRCQEHKELKLSQLAENIKKSQKQITAPLRKTQLAFVDSLVKPPRNVLRKQEQFGTKAKLIATPAARVAALSVVTPNAAKTGDARLRVSAAVRDNAQVSSSTTRVKKAPLMAKTLQLMRGRHKR